MQILIIVLLIVILFVLFYIYKKINKLENQITEYLKKKDADVQNLLKSFNSKTYLQK